VLLRDAGGRLQRAGAVLVVLGRHLLLFHLPVHHRTGRFRPGDTAPAELPAAVPALRHR